ncbi:hypothetical protein LTR15_007761 [Elasticomyces elasticus]|nr:hypothetical protein LTR15_007761 [Elasticomyces elasticus]
MPYICCGLRVHCPVRKYFRRAKRAIFGQYTPIVHHDQDAARLNARVIQIFPGSTETVHVKIHKSHAAIDEWFYHPVHGCHLPGSK